MATFDTFGTFGTSDTSRGFTLIEMSLVMGIFLTLIGITFVGFLSLQGQSSLVAGKSVLLSDIQSQQIKAMVGDTQETNTISDYGVYFEGSSYTLFRGSSYSVSDQSNIVITLEPSLSFDEIDLPASQIVFTKGSGELSGYSQTDNSLKVLNTDLNREILIQFNKYGVITSGD